MDQSILNDITECAKEAFGNDTEVKLLSNGLSQFEPIVIVVNLGNYKKNHSESIPFRAKLEKIDGNCGIVTSIKTGNKYEIYLDQILEYMDEDDMLNLIDCDRF